MLKCFFEDNGEAKHGLRHLVTDAIIIKDQQILLVKRAAHLTNGGKWAMAGGYVGCDETAAAAALREVKEESGYNGKIVKLLEVVDKPHRKGDDLNRQNIALMYLIEAGEKVQEEDSETSEARWFDFAKLPPEEDFAFDHFEIIKKYLTNIK